MSSNNQMERIDLIEQAKVWLREDMEKSPPYEPHKQSYDYHEKNRYIDRVNQIGHGLLQSGVFVLAEIYFESLLAEIRAFELAHNKVFNKGIAYANLGIAQIYNGKFERGIAHLLTAEREDRDVNPIEYDILNEILWRQFELNYLFPKLYQWNSYIHAALTFTVNESFLDSLFRQMDKQHRIFLQGTLWYLFNNIEQTSVQQNMYTSDRLYSALRDLCLLIEVLLRKKQNSTSQIMLGDLLEKALTPLGINYNKRMVNQYANSLTQFLDHLETILSISDAIVRQACCALLVRNFTSHQLDISETITSTTGKSFWGDLFQPALQNLIAALFYLKKVGAL